MLFVHDRKQANVWLIDFAKTVLLPENHCIDHFSTWKVGNHEDGYLIGINNLLELFSELEMEINTITDSSTASSSSLTPSTGSSPASLSPKRSTSETNMEDLPKRESLVTEAEGVVVGVSEDGSNTTPTEMQEQIVTDTNFNPVFPESKEKHEEKEKFEQKN